jgi:hypothetical protein
LDGFVIRIPQAKLTSSACSPKPFFPSSTIDARTGFSNHDFPALPSLDNVLALESELSTSLLNPSLLWDNNDQPIDQNIPSGGYDPSNMPSSLANGFGPWISQTQDPFAMNVEDSLSISFIPEPSIAGEKVNLESSSKSMSEQVTETDTVVSTETPGKRIPCDQPGCNLTFSRHSDQIRHRDTVHQASQTVRLCPVAGCTKSRGRGYSRDDKITEHLWRKHPELGYKKAGS